MTLGKQENKWTKEQGNLKNDLFISLIKVYINIQHVVQLGK